MGRDSVFQSDSQEPSDHGSADSLTPVYFTEMCHNTPGTFLIPHSKNETTY